MPEDIRQDETVQDEPQDGAVENEPVDFDEAVRRCALNRDRRYSVHAYEFVYAALGFTQQAMGRDSGGSGEPCRHLSGQELLEGIRRLAIERFGLLALPVMKQWGVHRTEDFGEIVFNLIECGQLRKTEEDTRSDFAGGYSFEAAFGGPLQLR